MNYVTNELYHMLWHASVGREVMHGNNNTK